uniref:Ig-like domain-containing protein n=1 Tax=Amphilophus citrinellus TaxID=61819 RepID=A0A3Q0S1S7_AMPCI
VRVYVLYVLGALSAAGEIFIAEVGQKVRLGCGVSSYRRSLEYEGLVVSCTGELAKRTSVRHVNLEISGVRETDAGKFTCLADKTSKEHSLVVVSVSVSVAPSAVLQLGSEATLQCDVKGLDEGYEVKWKSPNAGLPEGTSTTQLKPVTSLHDGTWQCVITYGSNQISESLTIKVKGNTHVLGMKTLIYLCDQNKKRGVWCTAMDDPLGISCWMWLAMGVCCLFGILLMLCVMVCVNVFCKGDKQRPLERNSSNLYV